MNATVDSSSSTWYNWTSPEGVAPNLQSSEANERLKQRILARQQNGNDEGPPAAEATTFLSSLSSLWPVSSESAPPPVITTPKVNPEIAVQRSFSTTVPGIPSISTGEMKTFGGVTNLSIPVVQTPHDNMTAMNISRSSRTVPSLMLPKPEPLIESSSPTPTSPPMFTFNGAPDVRTSSSSAVLPSSTYQSSIWPFGSSATRISDEEFSIFQQQYLAMEQERNELLAEKQAQIDMIGGHNPLLERRLKELESRLKMNDDKVVQLTAEKDYLCDALKVAQGQTAASYELVREKQKKIDDLENKFRSQSTRDTGQLTSASSLLDNAGAEIKHLHDLVNAKQQKIEELSRENRVNEYSYQDKLQGAKDLVDGARAEITILHDRIALLERSIVNPPPPPPPSHPNNSTNLPGTPGTPSTMHPADQRWIDAAFEGNHVTDTTMQDMKDRLAALEAAAAADKKKMVQLQLQLEQAERRAKRKSCWC